MSFPDITGALAAAMPALRGSLTANQPLAPYTWFRVGGPAQVLFLPADEADLAYFLARLASDVPVTIVGLASNTLSFATAAYRPVSSSSGSAVKASAKSMSRLVSACASALQCRT